MVRSEVLEKRLRKIDQYLQVLVEISKQNYEEFASNALLYGSAERFLHLSIECLNDIGNHLIADLELGTVSMYRDIPEILFQKQYISRDHENIWIKMNGLRNVLAHDYLDIDRKIIFNILQENLDQIRQLKNCFAQFL